MMMAIWSTVLLIVDNNNKDNDENESKGSKNKNHCTENHNDNQK